MKPLDEFPRDFTEILWDMRDHQFDAEQEAKLTEWANEILKSVQDNPDFWKKQPEIPTNKTIEELIEAFQDLLDIAEGCLWWFTLGSLPPMDPGNMVRFLREDFGRRWPFRDINEKQTYEIGWLGMCAGMGLLYTHQRKHWELAMDPDNRGDIDTVDMWLQYTLFGEIKYVV